MQSNSSLITMCVLLMEAKLSREQRGVAGRNERVRKMKFLCVDANFTRGFLLKPHQHPKSNMPYNFVLKSYFIWWASYILAEQKPVGSTKTVRDNQVDKKVGWVFLGQLHLRSCNSDRPNKVTGSGFFRFNRRIGLSLITMPLPLSPFPTSSTSPLELDVPNLFVLDWISIPHLEKTESIHE